MLRHRLAWFAAAALLLGAFAGCMKPAASSPAAPLVIPVAAVDAPGIAAGATIDAPHSSAPDDGYAVGERVAVESHGSWLPATLIERRGDRWLVRYDAAWGGAREALEELVERDRIRVSVEHVDEEHTPGDVDP
ncbi:MAG: hypothetical protein JWO86_3479 [Myxococcaceae bacterium]|nr:hypothetical protein [Myxococcaceae bacterium]